MKINYKKIVFYLLIVVVVVIISWNKPFIAFKGFREVKETETKIVLIAPSSVLDSNLIETELEPLTGLPVSLLDRNERETIEAVSRGQTADAIVYRQDFAHRLFSRSLMKRLDLGFLSEIEEFGLSDYPFTKWLGYRTGDGPIYSVPYAARETGLVGSKDLLSADLSWKILTQDDRVKGIALPDYEITPYIGMLIDSIPLGAMEEETEEVLEALEEVMTLLFENNIYLYSDASELESLFRENLVEIAIVGKEIGLALEDNLPQLMYALPEEGGFGWIYSIGVPVRNQNDAQSYALISAMVSPEFGVEMYRETGNVILVTEISNELDGAERQRFLDALEEVEALNLIPSLNASTKEIVDEYIKEKLGLSNKNQE